MALMVMMSEEAVPVLKQIPHHEDVQDENARDQS
jgi:hypothetical protein